jgi:sugar O-acyltransferase (sialic acid O-acetyltransferase NeuD family)
MSALLLLAAGGLAREVIASVSRSGVHHVVGLLDDDPGLAGTTVSGVRVVGDIASLSGHSDVALLICAGRGPTRRRIAERLAAAGIGSDRFATVIDVSVAVPSGCTVGRGSIVLAQVAMTAAVRIGAHVVVMPNTTLTHDVVVHDFATLCAGVSLGGAVVVGNGAYLGMNAGVRENITVGRDAVLGMGAALLSDLPAGETWVGVPARPMGVAAVPAMRTSR